MKNNTLYASNYAYGFEKARINGVESKDIISGAEEAGEFKMSSKLEYLEDTYDEKQVLVQRLLEIKIQEK